MNEMQREVLAANGPDLRDIIVTESLLGAMYFRKIFDQEIIELIRAQRTPTEKISMVLDYLPRRGPNAFDNIVLVLHENYSWLAIMLQTSLDNRQKKMQLLPEKMEQENENVQFMHLKSETSQFEEEVKQLTSQLKNVQNEMKNVQNERKMCYSLLGVDNPNSAQPLTEILRQKVAELRDIKDQRDQLELRLEFDKKELQKKINRLSHTALENKKCLYNTARENEKCLAQMKDLKEKCERLESVQLKQLKKQETLYKLKEIVRELPSIRKLMTSSQTSMTENISEMYKPPTRKSKLHKLPKISYHHHHHHHYSDPTVASRKHTIKPSRLYGGAFGTDP